MEDKIIELPIKDVLSYSRIDCFNQCQFRYKLKYIEKKYTNTTSLSLQLGTLMHYANELKYTENQTSTLDEIWNGVLNGFDFETTEIKNGEEKTKVSHMKGLDELIDEYGFEYYEINAKSGMNVEDKVAIFKDIFFNEKLEDDWEVIGLEKHFEFTFNSKAKIKGFIDRVDRNKITGDIRVVDYKTSNKLYEKKDLATSLQFYIYALACQEMYNQTPIDFIYDMIFLGEKQHALTKGWEKRGFTKLNKLLDSIIYYQDLGKEHMPPKCSPLCRWCDFSKTNPDADERFKYLCEYHSNWTRENKTFSVNKKWVAPTSEDDEDWDW